MLILSIGIAVVFFAFVWGLVKNTTQREEDIALQAAIRRNINISTIAKADLEQVISKTKAFSNLAIALLNGNRSVAGHLNPTANGDQEYLRIVVLDQSGKLIHSSARQVTEVMAEALTKEIVPAFHKDPESRDVLVGRPDRNDSWRVPLLLKLPGQGEELGYLVAVLDLGYFLRLFKDIDIGHDGRIEIIGTDGFQFAELRRGTLSSGRNYRDSDYQERILRHPTSFGTVKRPGDDGESIYAAYRLENFPLIIATTVSVSEVLVATKERQKYVERIAVLASIAVLLGTVVLIRTTYGRRKIQMALERSQAENSELIRQLEEKSQHAYKLASHDHLTGLPNRMLFTEFAAAHLTRARRSQRYHAVFFVDLDHFKAINDTLGHRIGDILLQEVAKRYRASLRESDLVARFGGDEFVMLINDIESIDSIGKIAEKILSTVKDPFLDLDGHNLETSPSIGIAICPQDGENIDVLLKHADAAMYVAKAAGRGTYRFFDEGLNRKSGYELELLRDMRHAIRVGEFFLHFQPRVEAYGYTLSALEALVRWQHPRFGLIYPNDFISIAEKNELIIPLGQLVIELACDQIVDWRRRGIPAVPIAVNISAKQLKSGEFVGKFISTLVARDVPPQLIEIELTESCFVEDIDDISGKLKEIAALGIRISIDDYGTGFANIGHLKEFAVHSIKIDRSFVREINNTTNDAIIVDSIITLAHKLGLFVVAEGVETKDQLTHLKSVGCDQFQGYYFHRAVPAKDIESVLKNGKFLP
ncbi:diguanylate cyclase (GGDEF) domain-containing protein [Propionivibrio dicarboxylicus]|uniref:Diguanylate cyclase (GGDEF) domain-containing protein n=2 Tax=Propionivibrio dicarboxylicus TaxID=83767 RepID=A0A1G8EQ23_9RHOO|nr:diguanylate cyclase (GGDEF) domain-containing protein [Propionivibrio dicarboxylicus]